MKPSKWQFRQRVCHFQHHHTSSSIIQRLQLMHNTSTVFTYKPPWAENLLRGPMRKKKKKKTVYENELQYLYRVFSSASKTLAPNPLPTEKHRPGPTRPRLHRFCSVPSRQPSAPPILRRCLAPASPPKHIPEQMTAGATQAWTRLSVPHPIVSRRLLSFPPPRSALLRRRLLL